MISEVAVKYATQGADCKMLSTAWLEPRPHWTRQSEERNQKNPFIAMIRIYLEVDARLVWCKRQGQDCDVVFLAKSLRGFGDVLGIH
jgi:hypothetical protein